MKPEINVAGQVIVSPERPVLLRDLATLDFVDPQIEKTISAIEILDGLQVGQVQNYSNLTLARLLKEKISAHPESKKLNPRYFIPESVKIQSVSNRVSELSARNQIVIAFRSLCADCHITIKELRMPVIPDSFSFQDWEMNFDALKISNSFLIPLVASSIHSKKTFWVSGQVRVQKNAAVSIRKISPGEKITPSDIKMELVDVTNARDAVAGLIDFENRVSATYLEPYRPIFKSNLKKENVVVRGQVIKALSGNELFEITSSVVAEDSGALRDTIRVRTQDGKKLISAQIVDRGIVRIQ